jgi:DNA-binding Lrp family transcriptional regulator
LRKNTKSALLGDFAAKNLVKVDELDLKIISLLVVGRNNKEICAELAVPLSTIQRRTRAIFEKEILMTKVELNYQKLGINKGLVHIYLADGEAMLIAKKLVEVSGVISVSIHIGNSDVVAEIIYRDSMDILNMLSLIKRIKGVQKVVWSEEIYRVSATKKENMLSVFPINPNAVAAENL